MKTTHKPMRNIAVATLLVTTFAWACGRGNAEAKGNAEPLADTKADSAKPASDTAASDKKDATPDKRTVLARYESIRAALAKDDIAATSNEATGLETAARSVARQVSGPEKQRWTKLADAAKKLKEMSKDDADAVRKAFGDLSEPLLALLTADRTLGEGLHVFECPMAQGYKKWVQPAAKISNPYMGTRMPECGSESSL